MPSFYQNTKMKKLKINKILKPLKIDGHDDEIFVNV